MAKHTVRTCILVGLLLPTTAAWAGYYQPNRPHHHATGEFEDNPSPEAAYFAHADYGYDPERDPYYTENDYQGWGFDPHYEGWGYHGHYDGWDQTEAHDEYYGDDHSLSEHCPNQQHTQQEAHGEQVNQDAYCSNAHFQHAGGVYNPVEVIEWTKVRNYGHTENIKSAHYLDVIGHTDPNDPDTPRSKGMAFGQASIRVHETQHMLHYQVKKMTGTLDSTYEGLYFERDKGLIFTNPKAKVTDFIKLIPQELRDAPSPYQTYIVDQMKYESLNNIGYLFNEWACYRSNIITNLQMELNGTPEPDAEGHAANFSPHFFGYLAVGMHHLRRAEPDALKDEQFKAAFALYAESTWRMMKQALKSPVFGKNDTQLGSRIRKLATFYRDSPKFAEVKHSLGVIYGDAWVDKLMK